MVSLKNYTTKIPGAKSIAEIEKLLLDFGADNFLKKADLERKQIKSIMFTFQTRGKSFPFKLPANVDKVRDYLYTEYRRKTSRPRKSKEDFDIDAYNIAWRLIKDWVHAQLSIVISGMVDIEEVFLPYLLLDSKTTLSERFKEGKLDKLLPEFRPEG